MRFLHNRKDKMDKEFINEIYVNFYCASNGLKNCYNIYTKLRVSFDICAFFWSFDFMLKC